MFDEREMSLVRINKSVDFGQPGSCRGSNCSSVQHNSQRRRLFLLERQGRAAAVNLKTETSLNVEKVQTGE